MDALKKQRKVLRTAFTKAHNSLLAKIQSNDSTEEKLVAFQFLEAKMAELDLVHAAYDKELFMSNMADEEIEKEVESADTYKQQFLKAKIKVAEMIVPPRQFNSTSPPTDVRKTLKLPKIELPRFSGHIKEWLPFWSQFKKINNDATMSHEDKFQYLLQAAVAGSRAFELVSSFPPTAENYEKAIKCLKNRFGRDDLVVEFYVRELLGLALQNANRNGKRPSLSSIYDKIESYIRALETLGVTTDRCAAMLYPLVESSLPEDVLRAWQRSGQRETSENGGQAGIKDRLTRLLEFLQAEVENEERIEMAMTGFGTPAEQDRARKPKGKAEPTREAASASVLFVAKNSVKSDECLFCKAAHESKDCDTARKLDLNEKRDIIKGEKACFNCLKRGHMSNRCKVRVKCEWCSRRHVLIMCPSFIAKEKTCVPKPTEIEVAIKENNLATFCKTPAVCLQTIRVKLYSQEREKIVRAIIDTASQRSYIRTDVAKELGYVPVGKEEVTHSLFGGVKSEREKHDMFLIRMKSLSNTYACNFSVMNQNIICDTIPSVRQDSWVKELRERNIPLTDVGGDNSTIDVLIGADVAGQLMTGRKYDLRNGLVAIETRLGWTVLGKLPNQTGRDDIASMVSTLYVQEADLSDLWRLDVVGITDPIEKIDRILRDKKTREFLIQSAQLTAGGRYEVRLPFKEDHAPVSDNFEISRNRLTKMIEKLKAQNLLHAYGDIFENWLSEGIIEEVRERENKHFRHYLPHRPVIKPQSTTKIRPVFDASACKKGQPSLNQCLEKGPNLIELVPSALNRFRERKIGVVSDIKKAFLQISVNEMDRNFLCFLWMKNGELKIYRHCRVVFGLACSPFLLAAIIELLMATALERVENGENMSWSVESIRRLKNSFYVDNCVTSVDSESELTKFISEAKAIMAMGGFDLRGWESSEDPSVIETSLVLGLLWNKRKDVISINPAVLDIKKSETITKRVMLSASHRVFDPIGFTCPVTLLPKLLLQELWSEKIDWDTVIQDKRRDVFESWLDDLKSLRDIEIPRKLGEGNLTIHVFCDASGVAYAAAVFARVEYEGVVNVQLISARSRIAPKNSTIPRLELMAATIGVRLSNAVVQSLTREVGQITFWSDSTTVLAWIERDLQWGTFVHNRIEEIRVSSRGKWRYVPSALNSADLPSRGCNPSQLVESKWWLGPEWLYKVESEWPVLQKSVNEKEVQSEMKKTALVHMINVEPEEFVFKERFSSYSKIIRFVAWAYRFLNNCKSRTSLRRSPKDEHRSLSLYGEQKELILTTEELEFAEIRLLRYLQERMFDTASKNKLASFKTFRDKDGLIVLKTKIFNREDDFRFVSPILLDNTHEIVHMLVRETHERLGHTGSLVVMSNLREKFWIISLRKITKSVIQRCVICQRQKAKHMQCDAPPLPTNRVRDAAVFEIVGVDFAGPLFLRGGGKGWICIFTCAVYRAVHLELASSLSTEGFLDCFRRFVARRGRPSCMYSDNGTNFTGAANALKRLDWERIAKHNSTLKIKWVFNPPSAPWWGGWWERLIGVLKAILRKVLGKASMSYESLMTTLCDAEAIINSRPLTYVSEDPDDLKPLTPSMFLQEIREIGMPDVDMLAHTKLNKKLKYRQKIFYDLRERFRIEYLGQLLLKDKKKEKREVNIGDVVLIGDDNRKRIDWPLARVVDIVLGRDGERRIFFLKTKGGILKRPVQRIYPLEIPIREDEFVKDLRHKAKIERRCDTITCKPKKAESESEKKQDNVPSNKQSVITTKSGRIVRKPERLMY